MTKCHPIFSYNLFAHSYCEAHSFDVRQCYLMINMEETLCFFRVDYFLESTSLIPINCAFLGLILNDWKKL